MRTEKRALIEKVAAKIVGRQREGLRLYRPLPVAQKFHESQAMERIIVGSNQSSKTLTGCVEMCRALTGQDPYGKYPTPGKAIVVARDEQSIGDPIWRYMSQPGAAFNTMKDPRNGQWRVVNPNDEFDFHCRDLWVPNEPLLPARFIKGKISWTKAGQQIPKQVRLTTGWTIQFFSGKAAPPKGLKAVLAWFDEEIEKEGFYAEISSRLIMMRGRFFWTATPEAGTDQLYKLYLRGEKPWQSLVENFSMKMIDNIYMPEEQRNAVIEKFRDDPVAFETKIEGRFALASSLVFPEFHPEGYHACDPFDIPWNWTRYAVIDPGYETTAVHYFCVPPPDQAQKLYLYDELYLHRCDARKLAQAMAEKAPGNWLQAIYIDNRMARQSRFKMDGMTVGEQIAQCLSEARVEAREGGFRIGCDDVPGRLERVRHYLRSEADGKPRLQIFRGKCPWLIWEAARYRYAKDAHGCLRDTPVTKDNHAMDNLGYGCAADLQWVTPPDRTGSLSKDDFRKIWQNFIGGKKARGSVSCGPSAN